MKRKIALFLFEAVIAVFFPLGTLFAQGTAFVYQGRLNEDGSPANGNYDLRFAIYDSTNSPGTVIAGPITNSATAVSNGLFTVTLDFGSGVFNGNSRWLDIGVRTNGGASAFTVLSPRQLLTPVPYAIFANSASNLLGTLATTQLNGTLPQSVFTGYTNTIVLTNSGNSFGGTFSGTFTGSFNGTFTGNGSGLTSLNASNLASGTVADARLSTNVARLNASQTFTGSNTFIGSNTFSGANAFTGSNSFTSANTFTGSNTFTGANTFTNFGNSFKGSFFGNGLVGWVATNATAVQAEIDHGYLLTNSQLVTVTLPLSPNVGDIVRISGAGAGGWMVKENSGQSILGNFASYSSSYALALRSGDYKDVAASFVDGTRLYAVGNFNGVNASSDSGNTWVQVGNASLSAHCQSVACSADGKIVYAVTIGGVIEMSANSGANWSVVSGSATTISCTADGSQYFANIACSGKGTYLAKFTSSTISVSNAVSGWFNIPVPSVNLSCLAVSSDCTRLVAGANNGLLYVSANLGTNWTSITTTNQACSGAWMSEDGSKFAGAVSGSVSGGIYYYGVSVLPNTVSTNSAISGSQGSAVELQYIGNGQFMPVSSTGTIWAD